MRLIFFIFGFLIFLAQPAQATDDFSQMSSLNPSKEFKVFLDLAEEGDPRAQFILGDIYTKGRSGLDKDDKKAAKWFERAVRKNYNMALPRLAAIAKRNGQPVQAYKWYLLALDRLDRKSQTYKFVQRAMKDLVRESDMSGQDKREAKKLVSLWLSGKEKQARKEERAEVKAEKQAKKQEKKAVRHQRKLND